MTSETWETLKILAGAASVFVVVLVFGIILAYYFGRAASHGWHKSKREFIDSLTGACKREEGNGKE